MLKKLKLFMLSGVLLILGGCAVQTQEMTPVQRVGVTKPQANKALVIFVRPSLFGGANQATLYDGKQYIGTISAKTRIAYQVKPGKHLFMVVAENADFLRATLLPGKTYYIEVVARIGFMKTRFSLRPQNGQIPQSEIKGWISTTQLVRVNEMGRRWFKNNKPSVMQKRAHYLPQWESKPSRNKQTLYAKSGQ